MAKISINLSKGTVDKEQKKDNKNIIVGIDLGTTNSLVAYIQDEQPVAIKETEGKSTLVPSVIHFNDQQEAIVGNTAKGFLISQPQNTIFSVKRLMGKSYKDLKDYSGFFSYKIIDNNTNDEGLVKVRIGDKFYTPIELSAKILSQLKERAEKALGQEVSRAVITVPAYFNDAQRQATRDAGKLAGLDVLRIVNEPTAASLAYGIGTNKDENKVVAVYDLGGGTFDISVLRIDNGIFEVLSTNGDTFLGGDDLDRALTKHWQTTLGLSDEDLINNRPLMQELRLTAEEAKKQLSSTDAFEGSVNGKAVSITKAEFEALIQPLIKKTIDACKQALKDAEISKKEVDDVILVGGSTRVPAVREAVAKFFKKEVNTSLNPDEVVALGAAVQADILAGNRKDILLLDVTPLSLGIETVGGLMDTIIPRNSKVPIRAGRQYTTSVDGQKNLKVAVFQGERDLVQDNRKLGEFVLRGIPPMPAGLPKIEIHFILDADGIVKVRAKELRSGVEQTVEMRSTYGISEEDMARMLLESVKNAKDDMKVRALVEARTEAQSVLLATDKFLKQNDTLFSDEEKQGIIDRAKLLKDSTEGEDKDLIQKYMDELNEYASPLAQKAMDSTISTAMQGKKL